MADELGFQRELKESVIALGGFSTKLSNRFTVGVPDLGVWLAPFVPLIIECKDLGAVVDKFDVQLGVTAKQADTMKRMQQSYGPRYGSAVCAVAVHLRHRGARLCVLLPATATRLTWEYPPELVCTRQKTGIRYPELLGVFKNLGVGRMA